MQVKKERKKIKEVKKESKKRRKRGRKEGREEKNLIASRLTERLSVIGVGRERERGGAGGSRVVRSEFIVG